MKFLLRSWRFCCALGVSAAFRVILTKILNRSGNAVQWNGGIRIVFSDDFGICFVWVPTRIATPKQSASIGMGLFKKFRP